jgi:hypothetical protein
MLQENDLLVRAVGILNMQLMQIEEVLKQLVEALQEKQYR